MTVPPLAQQAGGAAERDVHQGPGLALLELAERVRQSGHGAGPRNMDYAPARWP